MNTFITYPDFPGFTKSARVLDKFRVNKQAIECKQIWMSVTGNYEDEKADFYEKQVRNHPVTKLWEKNLKTLLRFGLACRRVATEIGIADNTGMEEWFRSTLRGVHLSSDEGEMWWIDDPTYLHQQRALLVSKDDYYRDAYFPHVLPDERRFYPLREKPGEYDIRGEKKCFHRRMTKESCDSIMDVTEQCSRIIERKRKLKFMEAAWE